MNIFLTILAASVLTAPKGEIFNDSPVVTNVNLEGLAKSDEVMPGKVEGYWESIADGMGLYLYRLASINSVSIMPEGISVYKGNQTASLHGDGVHVGNVVYQEDSILRNGARIFFPSLANDETFAIKSDIERATNNIPQTVTNVVSDVSESLFNYYISATNDNFVAAVNASRVSVDDSVVAEIAEYAGVDVPTAGAASIGALLIVILGGLAALKLKKQDALSQEQMAAVNSDITADKVSKLEGIEAGAQKNPDLTDYAKKSGVVKLFMAEDDPYAVNDLGDLGTSSPRELLAFSATADMGDLEGNVIREGDSVYGTVGAEGFRVEREWAKDEYAKYGVYSWLDAGRLDISRTCFDEWYWADVEESFSVGTAETPDGRLGIVSRSQGEYINIASAMTPGSIYADHIYGGLINNSDPGYGGVSHIEFSQNGDIGYQYYDDINGYYNTRGADIQSIVQVANDYSMGYLRFYEYNDVTGTSDEIFIFFSDIYYSIQNSGGGGISYGNNVYSYTEELGNYAFSLSFATPDGDSYTSNTYSSFGYNGVRVEYNDPEYEGYSSADLSAGYLSMSGSSGNWTSVSYSGVGTNGLVQGGIVRADTDLYVGEGKLYLGTNQDTYEPECYLDVDRLKRLLALINEE